jgi:16S rRNA (uracil1498-N3)-methyltransferase
MANPRFFCPIALPTGETIELPDEVSHHIKVLRLAAESPIILFNGNGGEISGRLHFDGKTALATLGDHRPREAELKGEITLWQGLASGDKMDWIVEKCVEIGVTRIIPISAQRSVLQLSGSRLDKRVEHWRKIAQAASEQCGRNRLMRVDRPVSLQQCTSIEKKASERFICDPDASLDMGALLRGQPEIKVIELLIGPEGGWCDSETAIAVTNGATAIRYGSRILRTETAGIALASATTALMNW